jgi:hypothetical protein
MEISLPPYQEFVDGIIDGSLTVLRIPMGTVKNGDTVTAKVSGVYPEAIKIRVKNIEYPLLYGITAEEAKREGYAVPDFCPSKTLCGSIESRTDFESLVFDQPGDIPASRFREDFEKELYDRVKSGCPECLIKTRFFLINMLK